MYLQKQTNSEVRGTLVVLLYPILFCTCLNGLSQVVRTPASAAYLGFGAYSNNHVDVFSFHANQASLAKINSLAGGIYGEKRFLLKELSLYNAALVLPTHSGNFGLDGRYSGFSDFSETQLGVAYARSLGSKIDVGVQFNYYSVKVAGYGNSSAINFDAAVIFHLTDKLNAGAHVYNPVGSKLGKTAEEKLPSLYSAGFGYEASDKVFVGTEIEKQEGQPVNVNAGLQYKFLHQFLARAGVSTASSSMFLGIGFGWNSMRLDAVASYHPQLGITPGLLLIFTSKSQN